MKGDGREFRMRREYFCVMLGRGASFSRFVSGFVGVSCVFRFFVLGYYYNDFVFL